MRHRIAVAAAFAAGLLTSAAYAGSPYYDADGQPMASGTTAVHAAQMPRAAAADGQQASSVPLPKMDPDGFEHKESDAAFFEHAVGSDGTVAESDAPEAPKPDPVYNAPMPKMDPDGFIHKESNSSFYEHAVGSDGSP